MTDQKDLYKKRANLLKLLSNAVRLEILYTLLDRKICVKNIGELLGKKQANISQHLSVLRLGGLIDSHQKGQTVCYYIAKKSLKELLKEIKRIS